MHLYAILGFVLCLSIWHGNRYFVDTLGHPYLNLVEDLSTSTYMALDNISHVKTKLTYQDHLDLKRKLVMAPMNASLTRLAGPTRRWIEEWRALKWDPRDIWRTHISYRGVFQSGYEWTMYRLCHVMTSTYKAAATDLEYYYPKRYFYRNIRDFEIGYLTHDIVQTYSNILELYHMIVYQYEMQNFTYFAPPPYMFFIYTNMALLGKHLIHQCNMIAEIENKYKSVISLFNDSTTTENADAPLFQKIIETVDSVKIVENITHGKHRDRQRDRKDKLDELFKRPTKYRLYRYLLEKKKRKPFKSKWPLRYGWSIEENWKGYSYWSGIFNYSSEEYEDIEKNKYLESFPKPRPV